MCEKHLQGITIENQEVTEYMHNFLSNLKTYKSYKTKHQIGLPAKNFHNKICLMSIKFTRATDQYCWDKY